MYCSGSTPPGEGGLGNGTFRSCGTSSSATGSFDPLVAVTFGRKAEESGMDKLPGASNGRKLLRFVRLAVGTGGAKRPREALATGGWDGGFGGE
jgi:hypothetical protein